MNVVYFDINACILCVLICITVFVHRSMRLTQNRIFMYLLGAVFAAAAGSLISSLGQNAVLE